MKTFKNAILITLVSLTAQLGISQAGPLIINNNTSNNMKCLVYLSYCGGTVDNSITVFVGRDSQLVIPPLLSNDGDLKWFAIKTSILQRSRAIYRRSLHNPTYSYLPAVFTPDYNPSPFQINWPSGSNIIDVN